MNIIPDTKNKTDLCPSNTKEIGRELVFSNGKLLLQKTENGISLPKAAELGNIVHGTEDCEFIGTYKGEKCLCIQDDTLSEIPSDYELVDVRSIPSLTDDTDLFMLAGTANHILHWSRLNRYCGCCGHKTINKEDERAKICPSCKNIIYPRISPAIITAIFRGDEILLAHNRNFKGNMHSLIAGFVEPGETLEECVAREIQEEIGIKVNNIRYFNSQPWPFPDSLMIAFLADYESGEITVDGDEITEAAWFHADNLPEIPSSFSIAGKIIRWYQEQYS